MIDTYALSFKKAHFYFKERNSPEIIEKRCNQIQRWDETDLGIETGCVFVDQFALYESEKKSWLDKKKGTRAKVLQPKATILGAITPYDIVNIKVKRPMAPLKKSK